MHVNPLLLPQPLGDAQEVIRRQVFGPRVKPGADAAAAAGTVTSVGLGMTSDFTVAGSPVTSSGTFVVSWSPQPANKVMAGPASGGSIPPFFRLLVPADYPVFVGAGTGHAAGAAPDPGATAHANQPYYLGDNAAWVQPRGRLLGVSSVATDESRNVTTNGDLTTLDTVTFTLDETRNVLVVYTANVYNNTANVNARDCTNFDGTDDSGGQVDTGLTTANSSAAAVVMYQKSLASGAHTVKIRHAAVSGGTGHWRNRVLTVWLAP